MLSVLAGGKESKSARPGALVLSASISYMAYGLILP